MAKAFRPQADYYVGGRLMSKPFKTYVELKKSMSTLLELSDDSKVCVYRHRRGEWGEWFEHWEFNAERKPVIVEQGWM